MQYDTMQWNTMQPNTIRMVPARIGWTGPRIRWTGPRALNGQLTRPRTRCSQALHQFLHFRTTVGFALSLVLGQKSEKNSVKWALLALGPVDWPCKQLLSPGGLPFRNRGITIPYPGAGSPATGARCRLPGCRARCRPGYPGPVPDAGCRAGRSSESFENVRKGRFSILKKSRKNS